MAQLAIKGGKKVFDDFWPPWPVYTDEDKRAVLKLIFADRLAYKRNEGFRTANLSLPFKALYALAYMGGLRFGELYSLIWNFPPSGRSIIAGIFSRTRPSSNAARRS